MGRGGVCEIEVTNYGFITRHYLTYIMHHSSKRNRSRSRTRRKHGKRARSTSASSSSSNKGIWFSFIITLNICIIEYFLITIYSRIYSCIREKKAKAWISKQEGVTQGVKKCQDKAWRYQFWITQSKFVDWKFTV